MQRTLARLALALSVSASCAAAPSPPAAATATTNAPTSTPGNDASATNLSTRRSTYLLYLDAWSDVTSEKRTSILEQTVSADLGYLDAMTKRRGRADLAAHLAAFQQRRPGFRFGLTSLLVHERQGLAEWAMIDPAGKTVVTGYDALRFDDAGRIREITGFASTPAQQAP